MIRTPRTARTLLYPSLCCLNRRASGPFLTGPDLMAFIGLSDSIKPAKNAAVSKSARKSGPSAAFARSCDARLGNILSAPATALDREVDQADSELKAVSTPPIASRVRRSFYA